MNYYRLLENVNLIKRWHLGDLNNLDNHLVNYWSYSNPNLSNLPSGRLNISIRKDGNPVDFCFADYNTIIISEKMKCLIHSYFKEMVFLMPVKIESPKLNLSQKNQFYLMNIKYAIECLNEEKSIFKKFEQEEKQFGKYKIVYDFVLDSSEINGLSIFKVKGYEVQTIVNEKFKDSIEKNNITGCLFKKLKKVNPIF